MHQRGELLGVRLAGQQRDLSAAADTLGGRDALAVLKFDTLLCNELDKPVAMAANFARYRRRLGKLGSFGLRDVEHVHRAESDQLGRGPVATVGGLLVALALCPDHRGLNRDALLPLHDVTSKLIPSVKARNVRCVGAVKRDGKNVAERVPVKASHCAEVGSERLALALLKLLDEGLDVGGDCFLGGLPLWLLFGGVCFALHGSCSFAFVGLVPGI